MRLAILSAGPSLATWPRETFAAYDLRIAVNSAAEYLPCEWWSVGDAIGVLRLQPLGSPLIYTRGPTVAQRSSIKLPVELTSRIRKWDAFRCDPEIWPCTAWRTLSVCAALQLACRLGAKHVDTYGHDMAGIPDWRGKIGIDDKPVLGRKLHNRGDDRWDRERRKWKLCVKIATEQGMTVRVLAGVPVEEPLNISA